MRLSIIVDGRWNRLLMLKELGRFYLLMTLIAKILISLNAPPPSLVLGVDNTSGS